MDMLQCRLKMNRTYKDFQKLVFQQELLWPVGILSHPSPGLQHCTEEGLIVQQDLGPAQGGTRGTYEPNYRHVCPEGS